MGNETGSWSPHQSLMLQSPNHDSLNTPSIIGHSFANSTSADVAATNLVSFARDESPPYAFTGLAPPQIGQFNQPRGWFYCLPRFRQAFTPGLSYSVPKEKIPVPANGSSITPSSGDMQKKFLVFDQSGDQTTLMVNSGIGTPFQCITLWSLEHLNLPSMKEEVCEVKTDRNPSYGAMWKNASDNDGSDSPSEMHEDSAELNALLYSSEDDEDDSYYSEDDEVTSTGHSPSGCFQESVDEVASSAWTTRKRKLFDTTGDDAAPLDDTASSGNSVNPSIEHFYGDDSDAQSSCGNGNIGDEMGGFFPDSKRIKKEKIRETVSSLQDIVPGGKGKDAVVVLDEAIQYLKSLKVKAKALGLATHIAARHNVNSSSTSNKVATFTSIIQEDLKM